MIYTHLTKQAMRLAFDVHKDQTDKSGIPYIYHPIHLAEQMDDENTVIVALLHDVVEDSNMTFKDITQLGFLDEVIVALKLLTHDDTVEYMDYIKSLLKNEIARKVKLADLRHNSDLTRLSTVDENDSQRLKKYDEAILILSIKLCNT